MKPAQIDFRYSTVSMSDLLACMVFVISIPMLLGLLSWFLQINLRLPPRVCAFFAGAVLLGLIFIREKHCTAIFSEHELCLVWKRKRETIRYCDIYRIQYITQQGRKSRKTYTLIIRTRSKNYKFLLSFKERRQLWELQKTDPAAEPTLHYLQKELAKHSGCRVETRTGRNWFAL